MVVDHRATPRNNFSPLRCSAASGAGATPRFCIKLSGVIVAAVSIVTVGIKPSSVVASLAD
jgi:hypothetical protein